MMLQNSPKPTLPLPSLSAARNTSSAREARGPSLFDAHRADADAKKRAGRGRGGGAGKPFKFDRETMETRQVDAHRASEMVREAQGLDSRFSRSLQTSFL